MDSFAVHLDPPTPFQPIRIIPPLFRESPPILLFGQNTSFMPILSSYPDFQPIVKVSLIFF